MNHLRIDVRRRAVAPRFMALVMALALITLVSGCSVHRAVEAPAAADPLLNSGARASEGAGESRHDSEIIPVGGSPIRGPEDAPVTIVAFTDFQCPFCQRASETIDQLRQQYPTEVRVVFKHFPLPFHQEADEASRAALAAGEQGQFWPMHDLLFENFQTFKGVDMKALTTGYAAQLGLDVTRFRQDYERADLQELIEADLRLATAVGVRGTPSFFINGVRLVGAQPLPKFEAIVEEQLEEVRKALASGTSKDELYARMVAENYTDPPTANEDAPTPKKGEAPKLRVEYVEVSEDDPIRGATDDYLVTIVEFADFQCPFSARASATFDRILQRYGDKVRLVFKHNPLPFHEQADEASRAALAAHQQGRFWQMHSLLFLNHESFKGGDMAALTRDWAEQIGLNVAQFQQDYDAPALETWIEDDIKLAQKLGARGTPSFFINGVLHVGAKPYASFEEAIDGQIAKAEALQQQKGLRGDALYRALVEANAEDASAGVEPAE